MSIESVKKSSEHSPWKILQLSLSRETEKQFNEFEVVLEDEKKQEALVNLFLSSLIKEY